MKPKETTYVPIRYCTNKIGMLRVQDFEEIDIKGFEIRDDGIYVTNLLLWTNVVEGKNMSYGDVPLDDLLNLVKTAGEIYGVRGDMEGLIRERSKVGKDVRTKKLPIIGEHKFERIVSAVKSNV